MQRPASAHRAPEAAVTVRRQARDALGDREAVEHGQGQDREPGDPADDHARWQAQWHERAAKKAERDRDRGRGCDDDLSL